MKIKAAFLVIASLLAGFAGGLASRFVMTDDLRSLRFGPVRASRYDLVGEDGRTTASLAQDREYEAALVFLDHQGQPRAKVGILNGPSAPVLEFRGFDGKPRILAILLAPDDRPSVQLLDKGGRVNRLGSDRP